MAPTQHQSSPLGPMYSRPYNNHYLHGSACSSSNYGNTAADHYIHHHIGKGRIITSSLSKKQRLPNPRRPLHSESPAEHLLFLREIPASTATAAATTITAKQKPSMYYFTWLVFLKEKWVPFDAVNQTKLEQTLTLGGTFVDVADQNFPGVKRVRVFPRNNYLSYLGVKYRLSRIMQPDAWLEYEAKKK